MRLRHRKPRTMTPAELAAVREVAALPETCGHFGYIEADVPAGMRLCDWKRYQRSLTNEAA